MPKIGDIVTIKNSTPSGKVVDEGKAKLLKPMTPAGLNSGQLWEVHFLKDPLGENYMRWLK